MVKRSGQEVGDVFMTFVLPGFRARAQQWWVMLQHAMPAAAWLLALRMASSACPALTCTSGFRVQGLARVLARREGRVPRVLPRQSLPMNFPGA